MSGRGYYRGGGGGGGRGRGGGGGGGRGGGRGDYYKNKYGNKRNREESSSSSSSSPSSSFSDVTFTSGNLFQKLCPSTLSGDMAAFRNVLMRIDGKQYPAYKDLYGSGGFWAFPSFKLTATHIQGDAFGAPSRFIIFIPNSTAKFPKEAFSNQIRTTAMCDYLTRRLYDRVHGKQLDVAAGGGGWSDGKGGDLRVVEPSPFVLDRTSVMFLGEGEGGGVGGTLEVRFTFCLPARGRTVLGQQAANTLTHSLPQVVSETLFWSSQNQNHFWEHLISVEDQDNLRNQLAERELVAFIADGAILPRRSGNSDLPMSSSSVVPFQSPAAFSTEFKLASGRVVKGMGFGKGVHLIVGGGFHGKTTVLKALEVGVYNKVVGDGREFVVSLPETVKIRAEDGRKVNNVDISPFINNLPLGLSTKTFSSSDASGSTSQAANIMEALEVGAKLFLVDEDQSATNFMIRDLRMQALVSKDKEPITPFRFKVRQLLENKGVSTILVIGGSGDYFDVADTVVTMDSYIPRDVTKEAKEITVQSPSLLKEEGGETFGDVTNRVILDVGEPRRERVATKQLVQWKDEGGDALDLGAVDQLVEDGQTRAIVDCIHLVRNSYLGAGRGKKTYEEVLAGIEKDLNSKGGLHVLCRVDGPGTLAKPRKFEIACALNRLRASKFETA